MRRSGRLLGIVLASGTLACAASRPELEPDVEVRREVDVARCRTVGLVEAHTFSGRPDSTKDAKEILREMKRDTAARGGNVLVPRHRRKASGVAYFCEKGTGQ